jgi:transposase-like protein
MKLAWAAEIVAAGVEATLTYYAMPSEHWRSIKTNNPLERLMREVRRTKARGGPAPDHLLWCRWGRANQPQSTTLVTTKIESAKESGHYLHHPHSPDYGCELTQQLKLKLKTVIYPD